MAIVKQVLFLAVVAVSCTNGFAKFYCEAGGGQAGVEAATVATNLVTGECISNPDSTMFDGAVEECISNFLLGAGAQYGIDKLFKKLNDLPTSVRKRIKETIGCFSAGTPVWTSDGVKPIETVQEGDIVKSWDEEAQAFTFNRVEKTMVRRVEGLTLLTLESGEVLQTTPEHPFWVDGKGWVAAGELKPGDLFLNAQGDKVLLKSAVYVPGEHTVYNFTVENSHTYLVGEQGVVVHNDCKANSEVWKSFKPYKGSVKTNGLKGKSREYYKWDYTHNNIEVYDKLGNHKGVKDPVTGVLDTSKKVPGRNIRDEIN